MKTLIIVAVAVVMVFCLTIPSLQAGDKWVIEPSLPVYGDQRPRGMEAGSYGNPYEVHKSGSGRYEISTPFPDSSKPALSPGQPLNPYIIEKR